MIKPQAKKYILQGDELYKITFHGQPLRCVAPLKNKVILSEVHSGGYNKHQSTRKLYYQLLDKEYYWPTMEVNAFIYAKKCIPCQLYGNAIHASPVGIHSLTTL